MDDIATLLDSANRLQAEYTRKLRELMATAIKESELDLFRVEAKGKTVYVIDEEALLHFLRSAFFAAGIDEFVYARQEETECAVEAEGCQPAPRQVKVPYDVLERVCGMAKSHVEDIGEGLEDHTYDAADNEDYPDKCEAVRQVEDLLQIQEES